MEESIEILSQKFKNSKDLLTAIGDENRIHLIIEMIKIGKCQGVRVGEIKERSNLSRPAVSHHLKILKDVGIVKVRKEGAKNYYYFDREMAPLKELIETLTMAISISSSK